MEYFFLGNCKCFHRFPTKYSLINNNILNFEKILCVGSSRRGRPKAFVQDKIFDTIGLLQFNESHLSLKAWSPCICNNRRHGVCQHVFKTFHVWHSLDATAVIAGNDVSPDILAFNMLTAKVSSFDHSCVSICCNCYNFIQTRL